MLDAIRTVAVVVALVCSLASATSGAGWEERYRASEPNRNLFLQDFTECQNCRTYTFVISQQRPPDDLFEAFKALANEAGGDHGGSYLTPNEALNHIRYFKEFGCSNLRNLSRDLVMFVDTGEHQCIIFPMPDPKALRDALLQIYNSTLNSEGVACNQMWGNIVTMLRNLENKMIPNGTLSALEGFVNWLRIEAGCARH